MAAKKVGLHTFLNMHSRSKQLTTTTIHNRRKINKFWLPYITLVMFNIKLLDEKFKKLSITQLDLLLSILFVVVVFFYKPRTRKLGLVPCAMYAHFINYTRVL